MTAVKNGGITGPARYVTRNKYADLYEQMKIEMEQQYFKEKLYERMWKIEGVMNELKNYHDLKRAQYRGLENTQIQAYFSAMALNIKRLVFFIFFIVTLILTQIRSCFSTGRPFLFTPYIVYCLHFYNSPLI